MPQPYFTGELKFYVEILNLSSEKMLILFSRHEKFCSNKFSIEINVFFTDSQSCALCSLTFCETHIPAFDAAYKVIVEASNRQRIDSAQLFAIAR